MSSFYIHSHQLYQLNLFVLHLLQIYSVILLLICWNVRSESTKTKREYFPSDAQYQTSTIAYDNDDYDVYGRTFKKKAAANAAILKQIEEKQSDGSYHYE